jgi:hypothetical protein
MTTKSKIENIVLLVTYTLFSAGQVWLFISKRNETDLYARVTQHSSGWLWAHIVLTASTLCLIWSATIVYNKLKSRKGGKLALAGLILIILGGLSLLGQFMIDFLLFDMFKQSKEESYTALESLQARALIKFFCYDLAASWFLGMLCMGISSWISRAIPRWSIIILFVGLALLITGPKIHTIVPRLSYILFTIALLPYKNRKENTSAQNTN